MNKINDHPELFLFFFLFLDRGKNGVLKLLVTQSAVTVFIELFHPGWNLPPHTSQLSQNINKFLRL